LNISRIQLDFLMAKKHFALIELHSTEDQRVFLKAALQTTAQQNYVISINFTDNYPNEMPQVFVKAPLITDSPHRYKAGNICYLHQAVWNPGKHDITFVLARAAKWLNKYEVWKVTRIWPGAERHH
jgi:ubiquitin-protein ligase